MPEVGSLGVATMAFEVLGQPMTVREEADRVLVPSMAVATRDSIQSRWHASLAKARLDHSIATLP